MQNLKQHITLIQSIILLGFAHTFLLSECVPASQYFIENLNQRQIIAHVKIVEKIEYENNYSWYSLDGLTKLEVLHSFRGKLYMDTLVHYDDFQGGHGTSFQFYEIGDEFLIKTNTIQPINTITELATVGPNYLNRSDTIITNLSKRFINVLTHPCDHAIIPIKDNVAIGMLSRNVSNALFKKYLKIEKRNSEKAEKFYRRRFVNKDLNQKYSIRKAYDLIYKRLNALR